MILLMESFPFVVIFGLSSLFREVEMNINADNGVPVSAVTFIFY